MSEKISGLNTISLNFSFFLAFKVVLWFSQSSIVTEIRGNAPRSSPKENMLSSLWLKLVRLKFKGLTFCLTFACALLKRVLSLGLVFLSISSISHIKADSSSAQYSCTPSKGGHCAYSADGIQEIPCTSPEERLCSHSANGAAERTHTTPHQPNDPPSAELQSLTESDLYDLFYQNNYIGMKELKSLAVNVSKKHHTILGDFLVDCVVSGKIQSIAELLRMQETLLYLHRIRTRRGTPPTNLHSFSSHEASLSEVIWGIATGGRLRGKKQGTGFFIEVETESGPAQYFVTNLHVIDSLWKDNKSVFSRKMLLFQENGKREMVVIRRAFVSALYDLAVLELSEDFPNGGLEIRTDTVSPYERVFSIGYPAGHLGKIDQVQSFFFGSYLYPEEHTLVFKTESRTWGGGSGSPVFDQKGRVVGVAHSSGPSVPFVHRKHRASASRNIQKLLTRSIGVECSSHVLDTRNCMEKVINDLERVAAQGEVTVSLTPTYIFRDNNKDIERYYIERSEKWLIEAAKANNWFAQIALAVHYLSDPDLDSEEMDALIEEVFSWSLRTLRSYLLSPIQKFRAGSGAEGWEVHPENAVEDWETLLSP